MSWWNCKTQIIDGDQKETVHLDSTHKKTESEIFDTILGIFMFFLDEICYLPTCFVHRGMIENVFLFMFGWVFKDSSDCWCCANDRLFVFKRYHRCKQLLYLWTTEHEVPLKGTCHCFLKCTFAHQDYLIKYVHRKLQIHVWLWKLSPWYPLPLFWNVYYLWSFWNGGC